MEQQHRFTLEKYNGTKSRYTCPNCKNKKTFSRYIDNKTGAHLGEKVGRCNREDKCGYHFKPSEFFKENPGLFQYSDDYVATKQLKEGEYFSEIEFESVTESRRNYDKNCFIQYLSTLIDSAKVQTIIEQYHIGTSNHWEGATVFWQINHEGKVRTGKIILYDAKTGKRVKQPFNHITWDHIENVPECPYTSRDIPFILKQCFYGEHLVRLHPDKPVAIVESEKTAIIASIYYPKYIWLAAGGINGLSLEKCQVLKGRNVCLFPDLNVYEKWMEKVRSFSYLGNFTVSDMLEKIATEDEKEEGLDLADYLTRYKPEQFI